MSDQTNTGKGFLREKLGDYRVNPPEKVWDSIASQLGGRSRRSMLIIVLSAAAAIALAVTLGLHYYGPDKPEDMGKAETHENLSRNPGVHDPAFAVQPDQKNEAATVEQTLKERERPALLEKVVRALEEVEAAPSRMAREAANNGSDRMLTAEVLSEELPSEEVVSLQNPGIPIDPDIEGILKDQGLPVDNGRDDPGNPGDVDLTGDEGFPDDPVQEINSDQKPDFQQPMQTDPRWIVGAAMSPLYSFRDAESSAMASGSEFESGLVAYAGGFHVSYRTGSRLAIESGVYFNKMGISIGAPGIQLLNQSLDISPMAEEAYSSNITTVTNSVGNIVARSGEVYVNNYKLNAANQGNALFDNFSTNATPANQGIRQHLDYLELPFNVRYTLIDRSIELQLVGGMSTNFLVNNYVTMETSMGPTEIGYLTNIRSVNYSGNAGIGMIYHLGEKLSLRMEPRFRYFLNSVNDSTLPSTRPYTFGLFTGMNFTF